VSNGNRPKLTLKPKSRPKDNGAKNQETRPKLMLGLRKKPKLHQTHQNDEKNRIEKRPPLTSDFRKKPALVHPQFSREHQTTMDGGYSRPPSFGYRTQKKPRFISDSVEKPRILAPRQSTIKIPKTQGKLEINIKISQLPNWVETVKRGWQRFCVNADGQIVQMLVRPRVWNKLQQANEEYPVWVANITGKMGPRIKDGFVLLEPAIQVYEKKPKEKEQESEPAS
jgi:hypothetical protein